MVDFKKVGKRQVKTPKMVLKLEIELIDSLLTDQEAADRLNYLIQSHNCTEFSNLIVMLIRETRSNMWEMKSLEINAIGDI